MAPVSSGNTAGQVMLLRDFGTTILCATPSYALVLAEAAAEAGYDLPAGLLRVGMECALKTGMHLAEDHFIPEIIDPETSEPLPLGQTGELVFTCVTKKALPLIRYRTHDLARLLPGDCPCGHTTIRMG